MDDGATLRRIIDEHQIHEVRRRWAFARDQRDWETVRSCFHPDARLTTSWGEGTVDEVIDASIAFDLKRKPEEGSKHFLGNWRATIEGDRATLETEAQLHIRSYIEGVLFDCFSLARFFDFLERYQGGWAISRWDCIFDRDRLDPVIPGSAPPGLYEQAVLTGEESRFAFMGLRHRKVGRTTHDTIVRGRTEREAALKADGERWLAGG